jgi:hypothetical protein
VIQELLDLKRSDKKDVIEWGTTYSMPTENGKVCHIGWKDQAFVLMMSLVMSGDEKVLRLRGPRRLLLRLKHLEYLLAMTQ